MSTFTTATQSTLAAAAAALESAILTVTPDGVVPPTPTPIAITTTTLPGATVGVAYHETVAASGGTAPYSWSATALPAGLTMSVTGLLGGSATVAGTFNVVVSVMDSGSAPQKQSVVLPLVVVPATVTPPPSGGGLPVPANFPKIVFSDYFAGTTVDTTKWVPYMQDLVSGGRRWGDNGVLPYPDSSVGNQGGFDAEYTTPSQNTVQNGVLTQTAVRDSTYPGYSWKSGGITTIKAVVPASHCFVQARIWIPAEVGSWLGFWMLDTNGSNEIDIIESGYNTNNEIDAVNVHENGDTQDQYNAGVILSAGYHTYQLEYNPGVACIFGIDGNPFKTYTSSIPTGAYGISITLQARQNANWAPDVNSGVTEMQALCTGVEVRTA